MGHSLKIYLFIVIFLLSQTIDLVKSAQPNFRTTTSTIPSINVQEVSKRDDNDPSQAKTMHPVSRLYLIQAKQKQKEPIFKEIGQRIFRNHSNNIVRLEFQMQVKIGDRTASDWGQTKKDAKRRAAISMLKSMGLQVENEIF